MIDSFEHENMVKKMNQKFQGKKKEKKSKRYSPKFFPIYFLLLLKKIEFTLMNPELYIKNMNSAYVQKNFNGNWLFVRNLNTLKYNFN